MEKEYCLVYSSVKDGREVLRTPVSGTFLGACMHLKVKHDQDEEAGIVDAMGNSWYTTTTGFHVAVEPSAEDEVTIEHKIGLREVEA